MTEWIPITLALPRWVLRRSSTCTSGNIIATDGRQIWAGWIYGVPSEDAYWFRTYEDRMTIEFKDLTHWMPLPEPPNGWIDVNDQLPTEQDDYLVLCIDPKSGMSMIHQGAFYANIGWFIPDAHKGILKYYMPLPEPPEANKSLRQSSYGPLPEISVKLDTDS
jgi:hypothetical protein